METVVLGTAAVGATMAGMAMMNDLNFQQSGQAVGNSPSPGTLGGGGLPTDASILTLGASLALVPAGLAAVAVFPPFAT